MRRMPQPSRRSFLKSIPAALAAPALLPSVAASAGRVSSETLRCAEQIDGVAFSDTEHELMVPNVGAIRDHIDALRTTPIDYDIEPAFMFTPYARTPAPTGRATPHAPLTIDRPRFAKRPADAELAFLPLTALASLVASRQVSSAELTDLYLARLKRYGGRL